MVITIIFFFASLSINQVIFPESIVDIRNAVAGDKCPHCEGILKIIRGIEVGHIFKLGVKYSQAMGATFLDQKGMEKPTVMGCYGIGISRTMAAAVEQNYDENGIIWPIPIAPYHVIIIPVNSKKEDQMEAARSIYEELNKQGIETIIDDRDERAGVKFKDADLTGIPVKITIGPKTLQENKVEVKKRWESEMQLVPLDLVLDAVKNILGNI